MKKKGAEIVVACLREQGVDTVFGYPGGTILDIYDALYLHRDEITHILTSHEQGASHAADGYARATGKVGVCLATSGPGSTNLVTGLATAYMDSIPVVAITCNVALPLLGKDSFQEVDITGITMPIVKHSYIVKDVEQLAPMIRRAFAIAKSGRQGPVLVDITKDVTQKFAEFTPEPGRKGAARVTYPVPDKETLQRALSLMKSARKPFLYVGGGAVSSGAWQEVRELAARLDAPVCSTLMGKGVFDETDPAYTGMIGMHGTKASNLGVTECDLLIALGARFSDRVTGNAQTFAPHAKVIHIDVDAAEINKNVRADVALVGDLKAVLKQLLKTLPAVRHPAWKKRIASPMREYPMTYDKSVLSCPALIETLYELTKGDAVITTDVGQHQMWAAQYYRYRKPRTLITSGGLGTMGYGLGACIGAKSALPGKLCVNIAGDGCFRMNMNELATASRYGIPIVEIIINNQVLGMVRQWQTLFYEGHYSATVLKDRVDYGKVAEGLGCKALRITTLAELKPVLSEALSYAKKGKGPVVIDCVIAPDDKVFPMVPAGASISDAFDERDYRAMKRKKK